MLTLSCRLSLIHGGQHNKDVNQASQPEVILYVYTETKNTTPKWFFRFLYGDLGT